MLLSRRALPALLRVPKPWRAAIPLQRRWFTPRHCRTVLLQDRSITETAFLESLVPSGPPAIEDISEPVIVVLCTPSLSSQLLSPAPTPSLKTLLAKVFGHSLKHQLGSSISGIRALCAVVDALPAPQPGQIADGFSYLVLDPPRDDQKLIIVPDNADQHERGTLEFQFSDDWHHNQGVNAVANLGKTHYGVAITLANTLFQSGRKKSLLDATYVVDPFGDLHLTHHEWLASCSIPYHVGEGCNITNFDQRSSRTDKRLNLSLIPLTEPRKISVSLGNILRTLELPDGSQRPASHELEANLDSYFRSTEQQPHPRPVWAFLTNEPGSKRSDLVLRNAKFLASLNDEPGERSGLQFVWERPERKVAAEYDTALQDSILLDDSKLRRVLSGGGGWGDKAGLLALDPQDTLQAQPSMDEEISQFSSEKSEYTHVQFFTSTNQPPPNLFQYRMGFCLGVVPDGTAKWKPPTRARETDMYSSTFAALSQGSMSFRSNTSIVQANLPALQEPPIEATQTTIDVPFASFTYLSPDPNAGGDRSKIRLHEVLQMGKATLSEGDRVLRALRDRTWAIVRDTSYQLQRDAHVPLHTRREEIKPLLMTLLQIQAGKRGGLEFLSQGITRFNGAVEKAEKVHLRTMRGRISREIRMGAELIDRCVSQIGKVMRLSNEDAATTFGFDLVGRQRQINAVYEKLLPIIAAERPTLLENHLRGRHRTMRVVVGNYRQFLHNEYLKALGFARSARAQIDHAKRASGIPVTHFEGTAGDETQVAAEELRNILGAADGESKMNFSEITRSGGVEQGKEEEGEQESEEKRGKDGTSEGEGETKKGQDGE